MILIVSNYRNIMFLSCKNVNFILTLAMCFAILEFIESDSQVLIFAVSGMY